MDSDLLRRILEQHQIHTGLPVNFDSPVWQGLGKPGFDPITAFDDHMKKWDAGADARRKKRQAEIAAEADRLIMGRKSRIRSESKRRAGFSSAPPGAKKFKDAVERQGDDLDLIDRHEASKVGDAAERAAGATSEAMKLAKAKASIASATDLGKRAVRGSVRHDIPKRLDSLDRMGVAYAYLHPSEDGLGPNPDGKLLTEGEMATTNPHSEAAEVRTERSANPGMSRAAAIAAIRERRRKARIAQATDTGIF